MDDKCAQLEQLSRLKQKGIIMTTEFNCEKKRLLDSDGWVLLNK